MGYKTKSGFFAERGCPACHVDNLRMLYMRGVQEGKLDQSTLQTTYLRHNMVWGKGRTRQTFKRFAMGCPTCGYCEPLPETSEQLEKKLGKMQKGSWKERYIHIKIVQPQSHNKSRW